MKWSCGRGSVSVRYEYDGNGNNTRTVLPSGAQVIREYDAADRLVSERHLDRAHGIDNTTRFAYDRVGNLVRVTDNRGRETRIEYDLMNREVRRTERDGGGTEVIADSQYTYDGNGNRLEKLQKHCIMSSDIILCPNGHARTVIVQQLWYVYDR